MARTSTKRFDAAGLIVSLHVATGAAAGALAGSRRRALLLGPFLHLAGDRVPHEDIPNRRFEITSGAACMALLALRRGVFDASTLGAAAASAPDLEHLFKQLRPGGEKLFHGRHGWHRSGRRFSASVQLLLAGGIVGLLTSMRLAGIEPATLRSGGARSIP